MNEPLQQPLEEQSEQPTVDERLLALAQRIEAWDVAMPATPEEDE